MDCWDKLVDIKKENCKQNLQARWRSIRMGLKHRDMFRLSFGLLPTLLWQLVSRIRFRKLPNTKEWDNMSMEEYCKERGFTYEAEFSDTIK